LQCGEGTGGSSGGYSTNGIAIPSYQELPGVINSANQGSTTLRNMPDVSANADCDSYWVSGGATMGGLGGTSLSTPAWAGYLALANEQAANNATTSGNPTLGSLNPLIYPIGVGSNYDNDFHDITVGSNNNGIDGTSYNAVVGYDLVTGWGSPNGPNLINDLAPTSTNANFTLSATPSTLTFSPGGGGNSQIALSSLQGFSAATNLTVTIPGAPSNAPDGLSASLSASTIPAGGNPVTLMVSTTSATPGGTYVIGVTGTSGG